MASVEIYTLSHPVTHEIRYIGKANNSKKRLLSHLRDSKRRDTPVYCWIKKLRSEGLIPDVKIIEKTDSENWVSVEIRLIEEYKKNGFKLLNIALGGDEPYCSKETRAENGRKVAQAIHSDPVRKRFWQLKHDLAISLKQLDKFGRSEKANEIRAKLATRNIYFNN